MTSREILDVLYAAGPQWGDRSPEDIVAALSAAGYVIVRLPDPSANGERLELSPHDRALMDFDAEHGAEPSRTLAERIAAEHGINRVHPIVDDISHAIEDARDRGEKRGKFLSRN